MLLGSLELDYSARQEFLVLTTTNSAILLQLVLHTKEPAKKSPTCRWPGEFDQRENNTCRPVKSGVPVQPLLIT